MAAVSLPPGWQCLTLSDIADKDYGLVDGPFGSNLPASEYVDFGVPVIRGSNLTLGDGFFNSDEFVYVPEETAQRLSRSLCYPEDIIFTKKGTLGQTGFVPHDPKFKRYLLSSNQMKLSVDRNIADPLFVFYSVSSAQSRQKIARDSEATGVPKTNLEYLRTFPILLPPLPEQRAIAHILGTLDDKIELNRRMNATLEAMARAIFKSWFVDFDPVHAKACGEQPAGMDAATAALFPDSFEESDLGLIPRGWRVGDIYDIADVIYGAPFSSALFNSNGMGLPLVRIRDLRSHEPGVFTNEDHPKATIVEPGDILVGMDGEFRVHFWRGQRAYLNQRVCMFNPKPHTPKAFLAECIRGPLAFYENTKTGTTVIHLGKRDIDRFSLILPPLEVLAAFGIITNPILKLMVSSSQESYTFAQLRDTLLTKLISGEMRVPEAERLVEDTL